MLSLKRIIFTFSLALSITFLLDACSSSKPAAAVTSNDPNVFIAPGYVKQNYKKILVLALAEEATKAKLVEDAVSKEFKGNGYKTVPAYTVVTPELLKDSARLRSTLQSEGYDAAIVLSYLGKVSSTMDQYRFSGTMFSVFYGAVGVFDLETREINTGFAQVDFFIAGKLGTQYRAALPLQMSNSRETILQQLGITCRKKLVNDRIL
jgi:hypothetical protein